MISFLSYSKIKIMMPTGNSLVILLHSLVILGHLREIAIKSVHWNLFILLKYLH